MSKNDTNWENNFQKLYKYILTHRQLPDKKKEENRSLLNWWKYNKRLIKAGKIDSLRHQRLIALSEMRLKRQSTEGARCRPAGTLFSGQGEDELFR